MSLLGQGAFRAAVELAHGRKPHLIVNTEVFEASGVGGEVSCVA